MEWFRKLQCILFGHKYITVEMNNFEFGGSSHYGTYKCMRCDYEENWQYDI